MREETETAHSWQLKYVDIMMLMPAVFTFPLSLSQPAMGTWETFSPPSDVLGHSCSVPLIEVVLDVHFIMISIGKKEQDKKKKCRRKNSYL